MSNLVINDLEFKFSGDATQLSREDQATTSGGCIHIASLLYRFLFIH